MTKVLALLTDGPQPRWVREALRDLADAPDVSLVVAVTQMAERETNRWASMLFRGFQRLDSRVFMRSVDALATEGLELPDPAADEILHVTGRSDGVVFELRTEDLDAIRTREPDVLLNFVGLRPDERLRCIPRAGVWCIAHGDTIEPSPSGGFFEVMQQRQVVDMRLLRLGSSAGDDHVIYESPSSVDQDSVRRGASERLFKAAQFPARLLRNEQYLDTSRAPLSRASGTSFRPLPPGNATVLRFLAGHTARVLSRWLRRRLRREYWTLTYSPSEGRPLAEMTSLHAPAGVYRADPFPILVDDEYWIFFEEYVYARGRGRISVGKLNLRTGSLDETRPVLERPFHLSYPCIVRDGDGIYMVPESSDAGTVDLYECVAFPDLWAKTATLLHDVTAVDPTPFEHEGRWWMFANLAHAGASLNDELHLFSATALVGPWSPHPLNPVKSDARSARPAGQPFRRNGSLYRPSQDCIGRYGRAVVINEVLKLSPREYEERAVERVEPWLPDAEGTHTLTFAPGLTMSDLVARTTHLPVRSASPPGV